MSAPILEMTNNPCKFCNGNTGDGKPICGDVVDRGDVACIVADHDGFSIEYWKNFENCYSVKINFCPMCGRNLCKEAGK